MRTLNKAIKAAKKTRPEYAKLINAVVTAAQFEDIQQVEDVCNYGASGGVSGFIYYSETHDFTKKHRKQIVLLIEEEAEGLGEDIVEMVGSFGYFRNNGGLDREDKRDLYKLLGGGMPDQGSITNIMAWYALKTVCRWISDEAEN